MSRQQLWQHPFVDVFKLANMREWRLGEKEGDVTEVLDKTTAKRVFKLSGSISAANYIQCPKSKADVKSLGLTGRYVYLEMLVPPSKLFSTHLDFLVSNKKTSGEEVIRVTLSNIFKSVKGGSSTVQLAFHPSEKWTVLVLSVPDLLRMYVGPHVHSHVLRSFTACSVQMIRGIFTSDILYTPQSLPRELSYKIAKEQAWGELYDWVEVPEARLRETPVLAEIPEAVDSPQQITPMFKGSVEQSQPPSKVTFETREPRRPLQSAGRPKTDFEGSPGDFFAPPAPEERKAVAEPRPTSARQAYEDRKKSPSPIRDSPKRREVSPRPVERQTEVLSPDPIMSLKHIIGYSGTSHSNVKWSKQTSNFTCYPSEFTQGTNKFLFYPSGCALVALNPKSQKQHFFFGHTAPINCLAVSQDGELLASGQEGKSPTVLVWELKNRRAPTFITLGKLITLSCIDISPRNNYLVAVGKDAKARELIMIWDIAPIVKGQKPSIFAKQVSDFPINTIKFVPFDENKLVSCGKENIRFWRIKDGHLPGTAVVLNHHARNTEFTDLDFDMGTGSARSKEADANLKRVFVGSGFGMVFQVNYYTKELEGVFQLHDQGIVSIKVTDGFCVTGSKDRFLRIWPLDFSEFFLEAQHEDSVCSVDVTWDGLLVACGTVNCNLGLLDMNTNAYRTILRSHKSTIIALDVHRTTGHILTISSDKTIRIWSADTMEESYEFTSPQDEPLVGSFHPSQGLFTCGFRSGFLRVFDIEGTTVKDEFLQHESAILVVTHSADARLLLTASEDAQVCLYDAQRKYQPVKTLPVELQGEAVAACFSQDSRQFAVLGAYGNTICVWDSTTFTLKFRINPGTTVYGIAFAPNGQDLLALTKANEWKLRYYGLNGFEGIFIKEIANMHPNSSIQALALSLNSRYVVTGGNDRIIKVWDYAMKPGPTLKHQAFIGHSGAVSNVVFSADNRYVISTAEGVDGLFLWAFLGDTKSLPPVTSQPNDTSEPARVLEEESIREILATVETAPDPRPASLPLLPDDRGESRTSKLRSPDPSHTAKQYRKQATPKRHEPPGTMDLPKAGEDAVQLQAVIGFAGAQHDNLVWAPEAGWFVHSCGTNLIRTMLRGGAAQVVMTKHMDEISTLKLAPNGRILASAAGCADFENHAQVVLWNVETGDTIRVLSFHEKGVQSLAFSPDSKLLVSVGTEEDGILVVWDIGTGRVMATSTPPSAIHCVSWDPLSPSEFLTVGDSGLTLWKLADRGELLIHIPSTPKLHQVLTAIELAPTGELLLGTKTGSVIVYSRGEERVLAEQVALGGEVDCIALGGERLVVAGQSPHINSWVVGKTMGELVEALTRGHPDVLLLDSPVISQSFEPSGTEGVVGTSLGTIWYVDLSEKSSVRVVSSHDYEAKVTAVSIGKYVASLGSDGMVKVWTEKNWSQVMSTYREGARTLCISTHESGRYLSAGQSGGSLELFDLNQLKSLGRVQVSHSDITSLHFTSSDSLLLGVDTGAIFLLYIQSWTPLSIKGGEVASSGSEVLSLDLKENCFLASTSMGKVTVWRDSASPIFSPETSRGTLETVDVFNLLENPHGLDEPDTNLYQYQDFFRTQAVFLPGKKTVYAAVCAALQYVFFRDFGRREVVRRLPLSHFPMCVTVAEARYSLAIGTADRLVQIYPIDSDQHQDYLVHSDAVECVCSAKNWIVSGSLGELAIWRLN